jgi:hypothetical protein
VAVKLKKAFITSNSSKALYSCPAVTRRLSLRVSVFLKKYIITLKIIYSI